MIVPLLIFGIAQTVIVLCALYGISKQLTHIKEKIMADAVDLTSEYTTLHQDLVAENGLIKQLLAGFATGVLTQAQAVTLLEGMTSDDADAKSNVAAITAALAPPAPPAPPAEPPAQPPV